MPGITAALSSALAAIPVPAPVHAAAENIADTLSQVHAALGSPSVTTMLLTSAVGLGTINYVRGNYFRPSTLPPKVPSQFPWLGCIFAFGERPIDFLLECTKKYGPVFSFVMFGTEVTYCIGSEASAKFWGSHNDILNAEDLYANITVPVFGPGVAYAVEHKIFSEQKQMAKEGLSNERFAAYTSVIEQETNDFIDNWGKQGSLNFFETMAGMIIFTATRCLHGQETRDDFDETVAGLYSDLDGGFTPAGWFLPPWLPLPSFRRRDRAHRELKQRFYKLLDQRRANNVKTGRNDLMETYMTTPYKKVLGGRLLNDVEVSGMMIALLMAGQHTSSTVSSWMMSFICTTPGLQEALYEEQVRVFKDLPGPLSIEHLNRMPLLHATVRETLRLRPPIMSIMRRAREDFEVTANGRTYVIPKGSQICVSPTANGRLEEEWDDPLTFDPHRFLTKDSEGNLVVTQAEQLEKGGKFKWVPFGAGRHRCIGFGFAQLQIRCILSTILRRYKIEMASGEMPAVNFKTMIHTPVNPVVNYFERE